MKRKYFCLVSILVIISLTFSPYLKVEGKEALLGDFRSEDAVLLPGKIGNSSTPAGDVLDRNAVIPQADYRIIQSMAGYEGINVSGGILNSHFGSLTKPASTLVLSSLLAPHIEKVNSPSALYLTNLGNANANIVMDFYTPDGTIVLTMPDTLVVHGTKTYYPLPISSGFEGSAVIASDQPVTGMVIERNMSTNSMLTYNLGNAGITKAYLPYVVRNAGEWNTKIWVQNAGGSDATVRIDYWPTGFGTHFAQIDVIHPGAAHGYDQTDITQLGETFMGFAVITSTQPTYIIVEASNGLSANADVYEGIFSGGMTILSSWQQKEVDSISSTSQILNLSTTTNSVTASYYDDGGSPISSNDYIMAGGGSLSLPVASNSQVPAGFRGYLQISGQGSLASISALSGSGMNEQDTFAFFQGISSSTATNSVVFAVAEKVDASGASTRFSIYNSSSSTANAGIQLINQNGSLTATLNPFIAAHGVYRFSTEDVSQLGSNWHGSAWVFADQPILGAALLIKTLSLDKEVFIPFIAR